MYLREKKKKEDSTLLLESIEEDRVVERGWGLHKSFRSEDGRAKSVARAVHVHC